MTKQPGCINLPMPFLHLFPSHDLAPFLLNYAPWRLLLTFTFSSWTSYNSPFQGAQEKMHPAPSQTINTNPGAIFAPQHSESRTSLNSNWNAKDY
jgi:hypothetical protein